MLKKINVSFRLIGEENLGSDFVLTKDTKNTYQTWIPEKEYEVKLGSTVGDVFKQALDDNGLKISWLGKRIYQYNSITGRILAR